MDVKNIKNIYIIIGKEWTKKKVDKELIEQGDPHNFYFGNAIEVDEIDKKTNLGISDEIWCFGDCEHTIDIDIARVLGKDIWKMG